MVAIALCRESTIEDPVAGGLPEGYSEELWRPRVPGLVPGGVPLYPFAAFALMHYTGWFSNDQYGVYLVRYGGRVVHHSCVNPRDFRYPFMAPRDLQIGFVETAEAHRGRGLAAHAIARIVALHPEGGRRFWYLSEEENRASIAAAEKAGFVARGRVVKYPRLGLRFLGSYRYTPF
jgi:RimJ/RimL family protein N-acetyltransferase